MNNQKFLNKQFKELAHEILNSKDDFALSGNIYNNKKSYEALEELLKLKLWSLDHFLSLAKMFYFIDQVKNKKILPRIMFNHTQQDFDFYEKNIIDKIIFEFDTEKQKINKFIKEDRLSKELKPLEWLELIERNKFLYLENIQNKTLLPVLSCCADMSNAIRCKHYEIDIELAKNGYSEEKYDTYNAEQLMALYKEKHSNASLDDVIKFCINNDIYPYLPNDSEYYDIENNQSIFPTIEQIENAISRNEIHKEYKYHCEKLVRLKKSILDNFLHGNTVQIVHRNYREKSKSDLFFIEIAPSYSQYILNERKILKVKLEVSTHKISFNDLIFIKSEIDMALKKNNESIYAPGSKVCRIARTEESMCKIFAECKSSNIDVDKKLMPGTKKEWSVLIKKWISG